MTVDTPIQTLLDLFGSKLWPDNETDFIGRIYDNEKYDNNKALLGINPDNFESNEDYNEKLLADKLDATVFFRVTDRDPVELMADVSIYFSVNLAKLYPDETSRADELAIRDVKKVLDYSCFIIKSNGIISGKQAFDDYFGVSQNKHDMQPYFLFRIDTTVSYCYSTCTTTTPTTFALTTEAGTGGSVIPEYTAESFAKDTNVGIAAIPDAGYRFLNWVINTIVSTVQVPIVKINRTIKAVANFIAQWTLTTSVDGEGTISPVSGTYDDGDSITFEATPTDSETTEFVKFTNDGIDELSNPFTDVITAAKEVIAYFDLIYNIPFGSDAVEIWGGLISEIEGSKYFVGQKGIGNLLITDYDFDSIVDAGFPYKSASVVSAPVGNTTLIAADVNNFFYATDGTPNLIPVVSFFQNVDYANRLMSRHESQILGSSGAELYEARVKDITLYASEITGADLIECENYFGIPEIDVTGNYVDPVNGNDTTGDGSIELPYKTITKATAQSPSTVYCKSGIYDFLGIQRTIYLDTVSIGHSIIKNYGSNYAITYGYSDKIFSGFIIDGENVAYGGITTGTTSNTFLKCYIKNVSDRCIRTSNQDTIIKNCILIGATYIINTNSTPNISVIDNLLITNGGTAIFIYGNNSNVNMHYNKFVGTFVNVIRTLTTTYLNKVSCIGNNGTFIVSDSYYSVGSDAGATFSYENLNITGRFYAVGADNVTNELLTISNCNIESSVSSGYMFNLREKHCSVYNNHFILTGLAYPFTITSIINDALIWDVQNNIFDIKVDNGDAITFGSSSFTYFNKGNLTFATNLVRGPLYWGFSAPNQIHGVCIWWNNIADVYNNYITGYELTMVLKANNEDYDLVKLHSNIFANGRVVIKGVLNTKIIGNTFINDNVNSQNLTLNDDELGNHSLGTIIKNNIFYNNQADRAIIYALTSDETYISENNIFYAPNGYVGRVVNTLMDFLAWQALGNDLNSLNQNPNLTNAIPNNVIEIGEDLGLEYEDGLDVTTDWNEDPLVVVAKKQSGTWQLGAYVQ